MTIEEPGDVFLLYGDPRNFDQGQPTFQVKYIYQRG